MRKASRPLAFIYAAVGSSKRGFSDLQRPISLPEFASCEKSLRHLFAKVPVHIFIWVFFYCFDGAEERSWRGQVT